MAEGFGRALLAATATLSGEARARALAQGLEGTFFLNDGAIRTLVTQTIPELVGKEAAAAILPDPYKAWVAPRPRPAAKQS